MKNDKHIIWSNLNLDLDDWREDLRYDYPDRSEDELYELMQSVNSEYLCDERMNLNIQLSMPIIVIADLGLWHGRSSGYKMINSGNIRDCLAGGHDYVEWYVDKYGEFRCKDHHHDGVNYYRYRVIRSNATDEQVERLKERIYSGSATQADINRVTRRIGPEIGNVYGWSFCGRKVKTVA